MRIVFIITGLNAGGAEGALLKLLQHNPNFREASVIALQGGPMQSVFEQAGVRLEVLGMRAGVPDPRALWRLYRRLREIRPEVVSTWMYHADLLGGVAARLAGVPVVWGVRNSTLPTATTSRATRFIAGVCGFLSWWLPHKIISCSECAREVHVQAGYRADLFCVVPNGFDLSRFRPDAEARSAVREELGVPINTLLIGMFARFDPQKNHRGLLRAIGLLIKAGWDVQLVLAGGAMDAANQELARWLLAEELGARVHLLGVRFDVPRLQAALDVACLSSYSEAFPNVLGEAMACGVPCVTTDVGDSAYIVGQAGRVVPAGDDQAFAQALAEILAMTAAERQALGLVGRQRVENHFEIVKVAAAYERELLAMCRPKGR